jgi:hypothetical protein
MSTSDPAHGANAEAFTEVMAGGLQSMKDME